MLSKLRKLKHGSPKKSGLVPNRAPLQQQSVLKLRFPATEEVLATSELLNLIFSYLPPSTLILYIKRVCRIWYGIISNPSFSLRIALFLHPASSLSGSSTSTPDTNDLLKSIFPFWLLNKRGLPRPGICSCSPNKCGPFNTSASTTLLPWKRNPSPWTLSAPFWRKLLLSQPPQRQIEFFKITGLRSEEPTQRNRTHFVVDCPEGVTLGFLTDIVEDWIRESKDEGFVSVYREKTMRDENAFEDFDERYRGKWERRELYLCDDWQERHHFLFLQLDLDRYSLTQI